MLKQIETPGTPNFVVPEVPLTPRPMTPQKDWMPDESSNICTNCAASFTFVKRRHHCRLCGTLVCASCSPKQFLHNYGYSTRVRVCQTCTKERISPLNFTAWVAFTPHGVEPQSQTPSRKKPKSSPLTSPSGLANPSSSSLVSPSGFSDDSFSPGGFCEWQSPRRSGRRKKRKQRPQKPVVDVSCCENCHCNFVSDSKAHIYCSIDCKTNAKLVAARYYDSYTRILSSVQREQQRELQQRLQQQQLEEWEQRQKAAGPGVVVDMPSSQQQQQQEVDPGVCSSLKKGINPPSCPESPRSVDTCDVRANAQSKGGQAKAVQKGGISLHVEQCWVSETTVNDYSSASVLSDDSPCMVTTPATRAASRPSLPPVTPIRSKAARNLKRSSFRASRSIQEKLPPSVGNGGATTTTITGSGSSPLCVALDAPTLASPPSSKSGGGKGVCPLSSAGGAVRPRGRGSFLSRDERPHDPAARRSPIRSLEYAAAYTAAAGEGSSSYSSRCGGSSRYGSSSFAESQYEDSNYDSSS